MDASHTLRVSQLTWEAEDVVSVRLSDPTGAGLPGWTPGAHLTVHLPGGKAREYSLCSDPADRSGWTIAVLREPDSRGGSAYVHEQLRVGQLLQVEGPRNAFELEPADHYVLVAGGIGITPILAMARQLNADGADWSLLYAGRRADGMAFVDRLRALAPERVRVHADDEQGGPPDLGSALANRRPGGLAYCCGPEPLIEAVRTALGDDDALRVERFRAPEPVAPPPGGDAAFDVICGRSGRRVPVPADRTVLDALTEAGVDVPSSCTEGICGSCETKVLAGTPDHRDFLLTDAEKDSGKTMFVCVSRSLSPELTLDLD